MPPVAPPRIEDDDYATTRRRALDYLLAHHRDLLIHPQRHVAEIREAVTEAVADATTPRRRARLARDLHDHILGAGPLQCHLDDPAVTEIMVNGSQVIVEREGRLQEAEGFPGPEDAFRLAETMALRMGERLQLAQPIVDFAWQDGSRVNVIHPILTGGNVAITIRKPDTSRPLDLQSLVDGETLSKEAADLLVSSIGRDRRNLLFTGAQNSGKTTLMRAVLHAALRPTPLRRVVLIEDTPELRLEHRHVIALRAHTPSPGQQGAHAVTVADLTRAAKRQRPDLLILGEVRGAEGVALVDAAQSEAAGVAGTLHIARPEDLPGRFYYFGTLAGIGISPADMAAWVFATFHVVCHLDRDTDGRRRVMRIVRLDPRTQTMIDLYRQEHGQLEQVGA